MSAVCLCTSRSGIGPTVSSKYNCLFFQCIFSVVLTPPQLVKRFQHPGGTCIIGFGGQLAEVEVEEIEAVQLLGQSSRLHEPWAYIPNGALVRVETGPLAGAQGVFCFDEDRRRLLKSLLMDGAGDRFCLRPALVSPPTTFRVGNSIATRGCCYFVEDWKEIKKDKVLLGDVSDLALKAHQKGTKY
jgi:hypothetical protein